MATETKIELSAEAKQIIEDLKTMPEWATAAISKGMEKANQFTMAHIMQVHLTGNGPFPVSEHKLGVRSSRLRGGLFASRPVVVGERVQSAIGDSVKYAVIHEFGGRIKHPPRSGSVRLRTDASGALLRHGKNGKLATFAKASHKRAKEVKFNAAGYEVEMPERAPVRTGIQEKFQEYGEAIGLEIVKAWNQNKTKA